MIFAELVKRIIDDGIEEVKIAYQKPTNAHKLEGAIAGFEACRAAKTSAELVVLWHRANEDCKMARFRARITIGESLDTMMRTFWKARAYEAQVEWVCNVLSAGFAQTHIPPLLPWLPTTRGYFKYAEIVGVRPSVHPPRQVH